MSTPDLYVVAADIIIPSVVGVIGVDCPGVVDAEWRRHPSPEEECLRCVAGVARRRLGCCHLTRRRWPVRPQRERTHQPGALLHRSNSTR